MLDFYDMFSDGHHSRSTRSTNKKKKSRFLTAKPSTPSPSGTKSTSETKKRRTTTTKKSTSKKAPSAPSVPGTYGNYKFKKIKASKEGASTKYDAYFINIKNDKEKVVSFGSKSAKYYPDIQDKNYKEFILKRHPLPKNIDLMSRKALERYILWNKKDVKSSVESYKKLLKSSDK